MDEATRRRSEPPVAAREGRWRYALYALHLLTIWSIAISNILLGLAVLAQWPRRGSRPAIPAAARPILRLVAAYLLLLSAAVAASPHPATSVRALSEIFSFATLALAPLVLRDERQVRRLVDGMILIAAAVAASGLFQLLLGYGQLERRIRGPFSHYMTFAGVLLMVDLLLGARMLARRPEGGAGIPSGWLDRPWVSWLCLALINTAMIGSLTRNAMLGLLVASALVVALTRPRLLLLAPACAVAGLLVAPVPVVARVLSIGDLSDPAAYDRLCMAEAGLRMVGERPLLGIGPDQVRWFYPLYRHPTAPRLLIPHLHDAYLELAAERGIPELAVFLAMLATAMLAARRGFRRGGSDADLHLGVFGALLAFAVAALFENNWGDTEVQRVALLLLALPFCLEAMRRRGLAAASGAGELAQPGGPLGQGQ